MATILHTGLRTTIHIASLVAPHTVGRAAFWYACRTSPPTTPTTETGRDLLARAQHRLAAATRRDIAYADVAHDAGRDGAGAARRAHVATYTFDPAGGDIQGTVALVHGWTGSAAVMTGFVEPLTRAGYRVVAIDLPGHGASSGRLLNVPLGVAALAAVHAVTGPWRAMVGHSFGGFVAMALAAGAVAHRPRVAVDRLVLIAVPHSARMFFDVIGRRLGLGTRAQRAMDAVVIDLTGRPIETFEGTHMLAAAGVPTLVLHAPDDRDVPFTGAERLAVAPGATLVPIPGAGHRRIIHTRAAIAAATWFVTAEHADSRSDHGSGDVRSPA
jgi:pimeloyl-ACP methyl ester carboxylesterase